MKKLHNVIILTEVAELGWGHLSRSYALFQAFQAADISTRCIVDTRVPLGEYFAEAEVISWRNDTSVLTTLLTTDVVIIDSYLADLSVYTFISERALGVYFDDYGRLQYPPGILISSSLGVSTDLYKDSKAKLLLGPSYQPLKKEFWAEYKPVIAPKINTILVTLGGLDSRNLTTAIAKELTTHFPTMKKIVVAGPSFAHHKHLQEVVDSETKIYQDIDTDMMIGLMKNADVAIASGGQTLLELARLGVPTIATMVAENQAIQCRGWEEVGFCRCLDMIDSSQAVKDVSSLINDLDTKAVREKMSQMGQQHIDGQGAQRVVAAIEAAYERHR